MQHPCSHHRSSCIWDILRYSEMTYACHHLSPLQDISLFFVERSWSLKSRNTRETGSKPWDFTKIMKSRVFFPWDNDKDPGYIKYIIKSLSYTCQDWKHWKRLSSFRFRWGFVEDVEVSASSTVRTEPKRATIMSWYNNGPTRSQKSRFQFSRKYLVVSCCFMQCTSSASIFPRRRRFRHMKSQVSYGFMMFHGGDHMWPACDILRLSTETYNQRLQRCRAVESGWLQALHLLKRMKAMPPFDLNMSHFHPFPIHPNPRPELSWSFAKQMLLSRLFSRLLTSAHRFYWTYLNVIEHDWTIGLHMPGPSSSRRGLLQHCANCLRRRGRIRNGHRFWVDHVDTVLHKWCCTERTWTSSRPKFFSSISSGVRPLGALPPSVRGSAEDWNMIFSLQKQILKTDLLAIIK